MIESLEAAGCNWLVFGQEFEPARPLALRAGPLHLLYEPETGFVRRIRLGEREALRGIYAAVRDRNWTTVPAAITETVRTVHADSFQIEFDAEHRQGDIHFAWHGSIRGQPDGTLCYSFDGLARSSFLRNRIGLCVLHPIRECAGAPARQTRTDGCVIECRFPTRIEPQLIGQSPFRNLKELAHEITPGTWAELRFSGDVFEMEDQRNWTDASFKTYSTPLAHPFPVQAKAGTAIQQSVELRLSGHPQWLGVDSDIEAEAASVLDGSSSEDGQTHPLNIGLSLASHGQPLTAAEAARLRALHLAHVRADIWLADPNWPAAWERALHDAQELGVRVELALHLPPDGHAPVAALSLVFGAHPELIARVLALRMGEPATSSATLETIRRVFAGSALPIGAGSDANFCELNREQALGQVPVSAADFLFWPMNPQVHAADATSILETLEAQPDSLRTARAFAPGKPLVISPVSLKPRSNAIATGANVPAVPGALPPQVDPRQASLFSAAWTLGSLAVLADAGAASITLFETTGWRGVMERATGSPWPAIMPDLRGRVFPVFHLLGQLASARVVSASPPGLDLGYTALTIQNSAGRTCILLANLRSQPQRFYLTGAPDVRVCVLDGESTPAALSDPEMFCARSHKRLTEHQGVIELQLSAYALAFIISRSVSACLSRE